MSSSECSHFYKLYLTVASKSFNFISKKLWDNFDRSNLLSLNRILWMITSNSFRIARSRCRTEKLKNNLITHSTVHQLINKRKTLCILVSSKARFRADVHWKLKSTLFGLDFAGTSVLGFLDNILASSSLLSWMRSTRWSSKLSMSSSDDDSMMSLLEDLVDL